MGRSSYYTCKYMHCLLRGSTLIDPNWTSAVLRCVDLDFWSRHHYVPISLTLQKRLISIGDESCNTSQRIGPMHGNATEGMLIADCKVLRLV